MYSKYLSRAIVSSTSALTATTFFTFCCLRQATSSAPNYCWHLLHSFALLLFRVIIEGEFCWLLTGTVVKIKWCNVYSQEYVCHKVDKRIAEVIKRRNKERLAKAAALAKKEAMGDFSHLKNKKGELIAQPLPQPTLPNLSVDDDFDAANRPCVPVVPLQARIPKIIPRLQSGLSHGLSAHACI